MNFLNIHTLIRPVSTGPGIMGPGAVDWPLNRPAILEARRQGGIVIEAHGLPFEQPANLIDGLTDSLDQMDPQSYYNVLHCGFKLPLTNGSDHPARPVGVARCYVKVNGPPTYANWIEGIRRGRTFTTSGPLIWLKVNGRDIGETLNLKRGDPIEVTATAIGRHSIGKLQIVQDGQVVSDSSTVEHRASLRWTGKAAQSGWLVARCGPDPTQNVIFRDNTAHTSSIFVVVDGRPVGKPQAAVNFAAHLRRHAEVVRTRGVFENEDQRKAAMDISLQAAKKFDALAARLAENNK